MSIYSITSPIDFTPAQNAPEQAVPAFTDTRLGVIDQVRASFKTGNKLATLVGICFAFVPVASFEIKHYECASWLDWKIILVLGGLAFSFSTVYQWTFSAFRHRLKALALPLLLEGILLSSDCKWITYIDLAFLIAVNGIAAGSYLASDQHRVRLANWIAGHQVAAVPVSVAPIASLVGTEAPARTRKPRRKVVARKPRAKAVSVVPTVTVETPAINVETLLREYDPELLEVA